MKEQTRGIPTVFVRLSVVTTAYKTEDIKERCLSTFYVLINIPQMTFTKDLPCHPINQHWTRYIANRSAIKPIKGFHDEKRPHEIKRAIKQRLHSTEMFIKYCLLRLVNSCIAVYIRRSVLVTHIATH